MTSGIITVGIQFITVTLWWIGIYLVLRPLDIRVSLKRIIAIVAGILLWGVLLLASILGWQGFFDFANSTIPKIPITIAVSLIIGFSFLFSATFEKMLREFPMH